MVRVLKQVKVLGYEVKAELMDTVIPASVVKETAEICGLTARYIPRDSRKRAVIRAAHAVCKTLKDGTQSRHGQFRDHLARRIHENGESFVMGIVDEARDEAHEELNYEKTTTVRLNKNTKHVDAKGEKADAFMEEYSLYASGLTSDDIRSGFIYKIIREDCQGVALIRTGGLYFVPEQYLPTIQALNRFCSELGLGRIWFDMKVESDESQEWIWECAKREVKVKVDTIMRDVDNLGRISSVQKRQLSLEESAGLLKAYAELTGYGAEAEDLLNEINNASETVAKRLAEVEAAKSA